MNLRDRRTMRWLFLSFISLALVGQCLTQDVTYREFLNSLNSPLASYDEISDQTRSSINELMDRMRALERTVERLHVTLLSAGSGMTEKVSSVEEQVSTLSAKISAFEEDSMSEDCGDQTFSGPKTLMIRGQPKEVYCEVDSNGKAWVTILKRQDGSVDFDREWQEYKHGFGDVTGEHYLGNEYMHQLTSTGLWRLKVKVANFPGENGTGLYDEFYVVSEAGNYRFSFTNKTSDFVSLDLHVGHDFTTRDRLNDRFDTQKINCATSLRAPWWYVNCYNVLLTGPYNTDPAYTGHDVMKIHYWMGTPQILKAATMMMRRLA